MSLKTSDFQFSKYLEIFVHLLTVSEEDLFPGGIPSFGVSSGPGSVTIDHVNAGTGLQSFTVVSATNAVVNIPAFMPGTYAPVTATFTTLNPGLVVDYTLRAASTFHAAFVRVRCGIVTPTPTPTPSPTPGGSGKIKGGFGVKEINFNLNGSYQNPFEDVKIRVTWMAPDSSVMVTNGFYYSPGVYKARFAPNQSGTWNWSASIIENNGVPSLQTGSLSVGQQISDGFVKRHPTNNFQWLNDNGTPFNPIGIGDCVFEYPTVGDGLKLTMDGGVPLPGFPATTLFVDLDTYFSAYGNGSGNQRFNIFRWGIRNCSFDLKESINPSGNYYNARNGILGDMFIGKVKQYGMKLQLALFNNSTTDVSPAGLRYIQ